MAADPNDLNTLFQMLEAQGPMVTLLGVIVYLLVRVIKQQYADMRADRAELLAAYKSVGDSVNNLAKQMEVQNAIQKPTKSG